MPGYASLSVTHPTTIYKIYVGCTVDCWVVLFRRCKFLTGLVMANTIHNSHIRSTLVFPMYKPVINLDKNPRSYILILAHCQGFAKITFEEACQTSKLLRFTNNKISGRSIISLTSNRKTAEIIFITQIESVFTFEASDIFTFLFSSPTTCDIFIWSLQCV